MRKKTNEEFLEQIKNISGEDYSFLEEYKGTDTKIKVKHNKCPDKYIYMVRPADFLKGRRCPKCAGNMKKTDDYFNKEVKGAAGEEYTFLEKYKGKDFKIKVRHNSESCSYYEYEVRPSDFLKRGSRCPKCEGNMPKDNEEFIKDVVDKVGGEYSFLEKYKRSNIPIQCKHHLCGYKWSIRPNEFLRGKRCPKCAGKWRRSNEEFQKEIYEIVGDEYTFLDEYVNTQTPLTCRHNSCGHEWLIRPPSFRDRGVRCPQCTNVYSKGELFIMNVLESRGIPYISQYSIEDCKNKKSLRFDFAITDFRKKEVKILVEYDGIQHFEPIEFFGGKRGFEYRTLNDEIKNRYCLDNGIKLLRIPYWEIDNVDSILTSEISNLEKIKLAEHIK